MGKKYDAIMERVGLIDVDYGEEDNVLNEALLSAVSKYSDKSTSVELHVKNVLGQILGVFADQIDLSGEEISLADLVCDLLDSGAVMTDYVAMMRHVRDHSAADQIVVKIKEYEKDIDELGGWYEVSNMGLLHIAVLEQNYAMACALLIHGVNGNAELCDVDVERLGRENATPLAFAVKNCDAEMVNLLFGFGVTDSDESLQSVYKLFDALPAGLGARGGFLDGTAHQFEGVGGSVRRYFEEGVHREDSEISLLELVLRAKVMVGLSEDLVSAVACHTLPKMNKEQYERLTNKEFLDHFVGVCTNVDLRGLITRKQEALTKPKRMRDDDGVGVGQEAAAASGDDINGRPAKVGSLVFELAS